MEATLQKNNNSVKEDVKIHGRKDFSFYRRGHKFPEHVDFDKNHHAEHVAVYHALLYTWNALFCTVM